MNLAPREREKLLLHQAGELAQKRYARGLRLNYPESVALLSAVLLERIRDGLRVGYLMDEGKRILGYADVMPGVPDMLAEMHVEGTFVDGTKLLTVHHPICRESGDPALALYGSGLTRSKEPEAVEELGFRPGEVYCRPEPIELNVGRETRKLIVTNLGDRPIQVGSHYPFFETNAALRFDRRRAFGFRLDIAAGTALRFEPGDTREVQLVALAGRRMVKGCNGLTDGPLTDDNLEKAMQRVAEREFAHQSEGEEV